MENMKFEEAVFFAKQVMGESVTNIAGGTLFNHTLRSHQRLGFDVTDAEEFAAILWQTMATGATITDFINIGVPAEAIEILRDLEAAAKKTDYVARAQAVMATGNTLAMRIVFASLIDHLSPNSLGAAGDSKIDTIARAQRARVILEAEIAAEHLIEMHFGNLREVFAA